MGLLELFFLAVGLSMDAFAVSICKGLALRHATTKDAITAGLWFGGFQAGMPLLGYFLGTGFSSLVSQWSDWIAFFLLLYLGINMIREARKPETCDANASMAPAALFPMAVATSIDALAVGVTFAFLDVDIVPAVLFIGVVTFAFSFFGIKMGSKVGQNNQKAAQIAGGAILILIGMKCLL